jgi:uncharacterized protein DUF6152
MRSTVIMVFPLAFLSLFFAATLMAHHSYMGEYDLNSSITLRGVVTKVDWANPHISFDMAVKDAAGKVSTWTVESASPGALVRRGWAKDTLKIGEQITVTAAPAKTGLFFAVSRSVTFADGRTLAADSDAVRP